MDTTIGNGIIDQLEKINASLETIAQALCKISEGATSLSTTAASKPQPVKHVYITEKSPLSVSESFPRWCVRPVREGEEVKFSFDSVEDAVIDLFQHDIEGADIDVYLPNGDVVSGAKYL